MPARRRVAITGIGLVTPVGNDVATTWEALDGVKSGAAPITLFDASGFPTRIAAEVKQFDERVITAPRIARSASRLPPPNRRCSTRASSRPMPIASAGAAPSAPA